ncbi:MAG: fatty acid oxidation complex subunit alpha FadJ, partial [Gammaproteobacteria bacterium]|nr:fatty acid oxidation complex subunit alpha FadJ [Gammaproteobacteria bacterium]NIR95237.1 fatty acid oxidation complex subunit alpha FadJ [Gammaproteobacteria bacterium]
KALELILAGRILPAEKAYHAGLIDKITSQDDLFQEAINLADKVRADALARKTGGWKSWLLEGNPLGRSLLFKKSAEMLAKQTKGHYPAP